MIDFLNYIELGEKKYPIFCSLNVLEKIQHEYGSINEWRAQMIIKKDNKEDEGNDEEINIGLVIKTLTMMINEGLEIEGKEEKITEKETGWLLAKYGLAQLAMIINAQVLECVYGKNAITTQNLIEETKEAEK